MVGASGFACTECAKETSDLLVPNQIPKHIEIYGFLLKQLRLTC